MFSEIPAAVLYGALFLRWESQPEFGPWRKEDCAQKHFKHLDWR
jgi:hypothetical protein